MRAPRECAMRLREADAISTRRSLRACGRARARRVLLGAAFPSRRRVSRPSLWSEPPIAKCRSTPGGAFTACNAISAPALSNAKPPPSKAKPNFAGSSAKRASASRRASNARKIGRTSSSSLASRPANGLAKILRTALGRGGGPQPRRRERLGDKGQGLFAYAAQLRVRARGEIEKTVAVRSRDLREGAQVLGA